jgi:dihydroflavonol-4-reductase
MGEIFLVTGAAGHLGSVLVRKLSERGERVRALVLPGEKHVPEGCEAVFYANICDEESLAPFFDIPEGDEAVVVHTAGIVSIASKIPPLLRHVNVTGTRNIVSMCEKRHVKKLVYVSSVHAIPEKPKGHVITETDLFNPVLVKGAYAKTKAEATKIVLDAAARGLDASVVHPSGICGPYDNGRGHLTTLVIDYCKRRLTSGLDGGYDFVDVRDVAEGIIACCSKGKRGECYILSNRYYSVPEILELLHETTGQKRVRNILPLWFINAVAPLAEAYYRMLRQPPLFTRYSIYTLNSNANFSRGKAGRELGYEPRYTMRETLADTVAWLREQGRLGPEEDPICQGS